MKQKLIIYGIGSMASTYAMYLEQEFEIVAYTMINDLITSSEFNGKPLLPFEQIETLLPPADHRLIVAVGYLELNQLRANIAKQAHSKGYQLASYTSPSLLKHPSISIGTNTVVLDHTSIHYGAKIGNNVFISSNVQIGHDCEIADNVWINAGVCLGGGVKIGRNSFIGMNATLSHGIEIAEHNFVGAATLVNKSTPKEQVVIAPAGETLPMNSKTFLRFSKAMSND